MSVQYKDYYQALGVARDADADAIKKSFRKLAREFHPDVAKDKKRAEEKFKEINEAYEVLSDPAKRKKYDELGADWKSGANFGGAAGGPGLPGGAPGGPPARGAASRNLNLAGPGSAVSLSSCSAPAFRVRTVLAGRRWSTNAGRTSRATSSSRWRRPCMARSAR